MQPAAPPSDAEAHEALLAALRPQLGRAQTGVTCFDAIRAEAGITERLDVHGEQLVFVGGGRRFLRPAALRAAP